MSKAAGLQALVRAGLSPRGLSRDQAAAYIGVSPCKLDALIVAGAMPKPRRLGARVAWDRVELDSFFARLPHDVGAVAESAPEGEDVWDRVAP